MARDGVEAIAKFAQERPDYVILDYNMPRINGLDAAAEILKIDSAAKIIMLTADYTVLKEAKRIGIGIFLVKPISIRKVIDSVSQLAEIEPFSLGKTEQADLIVPLHCK